MNTVIARLLLANVGAADLAARMNKVAAQGIVCEGVWYLVAGPPLRDLQAIRFVLRGARWTATGAHEDATRTAMDVLHNALVEYR